MRYAPVAYRPAVASPTIRRQAPNLAPGSLTLGQRFDELLNWSPVAGDLLRLSFHSATAALGLHVWLRDKGFWRYFGLFLGIGQTVGAICDAISLGQRIAGTHPPD